MGNTCDNNLMINGSAEDIAELAKWIADQTHKNAPNAAWAALYTLEAETESMDGIGVVGSGWANHAYGDADFTASGDSASFQWASKNNPSLDVVILMAKKFPSLVFEFTYEEAGLGLSGMLTCKDGKPWAFGGGYDDDDSEEWSEDESEAPI